MQPSHGKTDLTDGGDKLASLPAVSADATYFAHYSKTEEKYTVNVSAGEHGSVSPASVSNIGCETASGDITATPDAGYSFSGWTLPTGVTAATGYNASSNPIHIHATAADKTITANFVARNDISYTVKHWQQNLDNNEYTEYFDDQVEPYIYGERKASLRVRPSEREDDTQAMRFSGNINANNILKDEGTTIPVSFEVNPDKIYDNSKLMSLAEIREKNKADKTAFEDDTVIDFGFVYRF